MTQTEPRQDLIDQSLARHREQLLDLSTRNPLLHFVTRDARGRLKPKRLELLTPSLDEVYRTLVIDGRAVVFEGSKDAQPEEEDDLPGLGRTAPVPFKKGDLKVQAPLTAADLQKRLIQTTRTHREFLDEQGVHCLYLGLGQLRWFENRKTGDDPYSPRLAPLILVPVTLERNARTDGFRLTYTGEDLQGNLTLNLKLREQGLSLPPLPDGEDLIPSLYFQEVQEALKGKMEEVVDTPDLDDWFGEAPSKTRSGLSWSIDQSIAFLGFFSFSKFLMYRDLSPETWPAGLTPYTHPLLSPLLAGQHSDERLVPLATGDEAITGADVWHVLDADSSQAEAIFHVLRGQHLVLQGPPGTGKSQTITNMIAGLVAQGKTVLFVAEKEAALSVVEDRLRNIGLGSAVLALHSKDAKKTAVRDSLRAAVAQDRQSRLDDSGQSEQLAGLVDQLGSLPDALNRPFGQGNLTPFEAMGRLLNLQGQTAHLTLPSLNFQVRDWDNRRWVLAEQLTAELAGWMARNGSPSRLTLAGSRKTAELPQDRARAETALRQLGAAVQQLQDTLSGNAALFGTPPETLVSLETLVTHLQNLCQAPDLTGLNAEDLHWPIAGPQLATLTSNRTLMSRARQVLRQETSRVSGGDWMTADLAGTFETLSRLDVSMVQHTRKKEALLRQVTSDVLVQDVRSVRETLEKSGRSLLAIFNAQLKAARSTAQGWFKGTSPDLNATIQTLNEIETFQHDLRTLEELRDRLGNWQIQDPEQVNWKVVRVLAEWMKNPVLTPTAGSSMDVLQDARRSLASVLQGVGTVNPSLLDQVLRCELELRNPPETLRTLAGARYAGQDTDWAALEPVATWLVAHRAASPEWSWRVTAELGRTPAVREHLSHLLQTLQQQCQAVLDAQKEINAQLELQAPWPTSFSEVLARSTEILGDARAISAVVSWNNLNGRLGAAGLNTLLSLADALTLEQVPAGLLPAAQVCWLNELLDEAFRDRESLSRFDRDSHETRRQLFRKLDLDQLTFNRLRVKHVYLQRLPQPSSFGQMGVLQHEFAKRARLLSVRDIMTRAGKAIQTIKPVFMMSPLSIASFLPLGSLDFDVVIFDEASQVKPSDALGALLRGHQAVVVGDLKQLGPSNFFGKASGDDDEDDDSSGLESLLALFEAQYAGFRHGLTWHYRSQHESLIQTSNEAFYEGELVTFPSASTHTDDLGLRYHHLEPQQAWFDRGGKRYNRGEAEEVVRAVITHARTRPNESLAVVTFSAAQQKLIADQMEVAVAALDERTQQFFSDTARERFVVKNLENVQGDERDVIMISVGYGYAPEERSGGFRFYRNFGPLGNADGWRRLNVLITRARKRIEVFANFLPEDITGLEDTEGHRGLRAFKRFLERCQMNGQPGLLQQVAMPAGLGGQVAEVLTAAGYALEAQVGSNASRIELAVRHPERPGEFVLGIELDGPGYAGARSVRDRDRLREDVLSVFGWRLHRIWSIDWFRDPQKAQEELLVQVQLAVQHSDEQFAVAEMAALLPPPSAVMQASAEAEADNLWDWEGAPEQGSHTGTGHLDPLSSASAPSESAVLRPTLMGTPYHEAQLTVETHGTDFHQLSLSVLVQAVVEIVRQEGPIHMELLTRRLMKAAGITRKGVRVEQAVVNAAQYAGRAKLVETYGEFLGRKDEHEVVPRTRELRPAGEQNLMYVSDLELLWTIQSVVSAAIGVRMQELPEACIKVLGLKRVTAEATARIEQLVTQAVEFGALTRHQDIISQGGA